MIHNIYIQYIFVMAHNIHIYRVYIRGTPLKKQLMYMKHILWRQILNIKFKVI